MSRYVIKGPEEFFEGSANEIIDSIHHHEEVDLYLDGGGGLVREKDVLCKYLSNREDNISIYLQEYVMSASFTLSFLDLNNKVYITPEFEYGMIHLIDRKTYNLRKNDTEYYKYHNTEGMNKRLIKQLNKYLPKKLIKRVKKGEDVIISRKDLKKYFDKKENIVFL